MQKNLRSIAFKKFIEAISKRFQPRERLGRVFMQPVTWKGSRKYMQKAYSDLMTICRFQGNPALFITFTGNRK